MFVFLSKRLQSILQLKGCYFLLFILFMYRKGFKKSGDTYIYLTIPLQSKIWESNTPIHIWQGNLEISVTHVLKSKALDRHIISCHGKAWLYWLIWVVWLTGRIGVLCPLLNVVSNRNKSNFLKTWIWIFLKHDYHQRHEWKIHRRIPFLQCCRYIREEL